MTQPVTPARLTWCSKCSLVHGPPLCAWAAQPLDRPTTRAPSGPTTARAPLPSRPHSAILPLAAQRLRAGGGGFARRPFAWS